MSELAVACEQAAELLDDRFPDTRAQLVDLGMDRACVIPGPNNVPPLAVGAEENRQPGADRVARGLSLGAGERRDRSAVDRARGLLSQRQQGVALVVEVRVERSVTRARQRNDVSDPGRGEAEFRERLSRGCQEPFARRSASRASFAVPWFRRVPPFVSRTSVDAIPERYSLSMTTTSTSRYLCRKDASFRSTSRERRWYS